MLFKWCYLLNFSFLYKFEGRTLTSTTFDQLPLLLTSVSDVDLVIEEIYRCACAVCSGHSDDKFIAYILTKKGKILDSSGKLIHPIFSIFPLVQVISNIFCAIFSGQNCVAFFDEKHGTIRCCNCDLLVHMEQSTTSVDDIPCCRKCKQYRPTLRALVSRLQRRSDSDRTHPSSHTPFRYLSTPERVVRYQREHTLRKSIEQRLSQQIDTEAEKRGITEDESLSSDLTQIMSQNTSNMQDMHPQGSFAPVFWDSQQQAVALKDARQMRWDPLMVRWCIYLRHLSSGAYETQREWYSSGVVKIGPAMALALPTLTEA